MDWRQIPFAPDYEVSEQGDVRRITRGGRRYPPGYVLTPKTHKRGYLIYNLVTEDGSKDILAHRLVCRVFRGEPPSPEHEVAHNDGTRTNNWASNLRWALPAENQADRKRHGTYQSGENCPSAKVTDAQAIEIQKRYHAHGIRHRPSECTMEALGKEFGISIAQVSRIVSGRRVATSLAS